MAPLDNPRHERFAQELAKGLTADEAYQKAGYSPNDGNCIRLKGNERIAARVAEILEGSAERAEIDISWVLDGLRENFERAMQHVEIKDNKGIGTGEYRYDGAVANKSLELLGKHLGMFKDIHEHTGKDGGPIQHEDLSARDIIAGRISGIASRSTEDERPSKPH